MTIFIDGYNLLKTVANPKHMLDQQTWYLNRLNLYAQAKGHDIRLIFDGGFWTYPYMEMHGVLQLLFVGRGAQADDTIKDVIRKHAYTSVLLITSDLELVKYAKWHGVESLRSDLFEVYVGKALSREAHAGVPADSKHVAVQKTTTDANQELDSLMKCYALEEHIKQDDEHVSVLGKSYKTSKKKSKRQRLLDKL